MIANQIITLEIETKISENISIDQDTTLLEENKITEINEERIPCYFNMYMTENTNLNKMIMLTIEEIKEICEYKNKYVKNVKKIIKDKSKKYNDRYTTEYMKYIDDICSKYNYDNCNYNIKWYKKEYELFEHIPRDDIDETKNKDNKTYVLDLDIKVQDITIDEYETLRIIYDKIYKYIVGYIANYLYTNKIVKNELKIYQGESSEYNYKIDKETKEKISKISYRYAINMKTTKHRLLIITKDINKLIKSKEIIKEISETLKEEELTAYNNLMEQTKDITLYEFDEGIYKTKNLRLPGSSKNGEHRPLIVNEMPELFVMQNNLPINEEINKETFRRVYYYVYKEYQNTINLKYKKQDTTEIQDYDKIKDCIEVLINNPNENITYEEATENILFSLNNHNKNLYNEVKKWAATTRWAKSDFNEWFETFWEKDYTNNGVCKTLKHFYTYMEEEYYDEYNEIVNKYKQIEHDKILSKEREKLKEMLTIITDRTDETINKVIELKHHDKGLCNDIYNWINSKGTIIEKEEYNIRWNEKTEENNNILEEIYDLCKATNINKYYKIKSKYKNEELKTEENYIKYLTSINSNYINKELIQAYKLNNDTMICKYIFSIKNNNTLFRYDNTYNKMYTFDEYNKYKKINDKDTILVQKIVTDIQINLEEVIKKKDNIIQHILTKLGTMSFKYTILDYIKAEYNEYELTEKLNNNVYLFAFNDYVYDLKQCKYRLIEKTDYISNKLTCGYNKPTNYDEEIRENIMRFIEEITETKEQGEFIIKSLALALGGKYYEKFYIYHGCGANGKTLLNRLTTLSFGKYLQVLDINYFIGENKTISGDPLLMSLKNKKIILTVEPPRNSTLNCSKIKSFVSGGDVSGRELFSNVMETFKITGYIFFECNDMLQVNDVNNSLERRVLSIKFPYKFCDNPDTERNEKQINTDLKVTFEEQLYRETFIQLLIEYYEKYIYNQPDLITPNDIKANSLEVITDSNDLNEWFNTFFEKTNDKKDKIKCSDIYAYYLNTTSDKSSEKRLKKNEVLKLFDILTKNSKSIMKGINYYRYVKYRTIPKIIEEWFDENYIYDEKSNNEISLEDIQHRINKEIITEFIIDKTILNKTININISKYIKEIVEKRLINIHIPEENKIPTNGYEIDSMPKTYYSIIKEIKLLQIKEIKNI